jgi:hypothetical protein
MFNSRVKFFGHEKLRSKWEGPFKVIETSSHGAVMFQDDEGNLFKSDIAPKRCGGVQHPH